MSAEFDQFAHDYEQYMARAAKVAGESPAFYAEQRMEWMRNRLKPFTPFESALDFGCGTGGSLPLFQQYLGCRTVVGVDPSTESLDVASRRPLDYPVRLLTPEQYKPAGELAFGFCNGVFHHILDDQDRIGAAEYIHACLKPGARFALWENNPWNPLVVYAMSLNKFDDNARTLSCRTAAALLKKAGFVVEFVDFCFFFPNFARALRGIEGLLRWCPMGAQYMVLARKP